MFSKSAHIRLFKEPSLKQGRKIPVFWLAKHVFEWSSPKSKHFENKTHDCASRFRNWFESSQNGGQLMATPHKTSLHAAKPFQIKVKSMAANVTLKQLGLGH